VTPRRRRGSYNQQEVAVRRALLISALALGVPALVAACRRAPAGQAEGRTLADFTPYLTRQLTPAAARARFGAPDEEPGSGLRIYVYRLADGSKLWLGFPGDEPIIYARRQAPDGTATELPLPDR